MSSYDIVKPINVSAYFYEEQTPVRWPGGGHHLHPAQWQSDAGGYGCEKSSRIAYARKDKHNAASVGDTCKT